jgi:hypothetical protein
VVGGRLVRGSSCRESGVASGGIGASQFRARIGREPQIADAVRSSVGGRPSSSVPPWISSVLCVKCRLLADARNTEIEIFVLVA